MKQIFDIKGMGCSACSAAVEKAVKAQDGVLSVNVSLLQNSMDVTYDEEMTTADTICEAVKSAGYEAYPQAAPSMEKKTSNPVIPRFIASVILLLPLIYLNMGPMFLLPVPTRVSGYLQFLLATAVLVINRAFFIKGTKALFHLAPNMDTLISIGAAAGYLYSIYLLIMKIIGRLEPDHYYFESSAMIFTLITLGKMLESGSKAKTMDAINKLLTLRPDSIQILRNNEEITIPIDYAQVNDIVIIRVGNRIPVDGIIINGNGTLDESALTGESLPVEKKTDDTVMSGSLCTDGFFQFRITKTGDDTILSHVIDLVSKASSGKAPIAKLADKISGVFVPIVMGIALVTFCTWILLGYDFHFALSLAISVLVISCPCALGLATPTAIMAGTGNAARNGILIRSAEALETAGSVNTILLDKTGTITSGTLEVTDVVTTEGITRQELIENAAILESSSAHPYAKSILMFSSAYLSKDEIMKRNITDCNLVAGGGITGYIDGTLCICGNEKIMQDNSIDISSLNTICNRLRNEGKSVLFFAKAQKLYGLIAIADPLRPESAAAIQKMKSLGLNVVMVTGDNKNTAAAIARSLRLDRVISEVLPEDKSEVVTSLQNGGNKVAMVGDGINDAPALAGANIGIAIGSGSDIAIDSADFILMKNSLNDVVNVFVLSKRVMRIIKQNLFFAFFYNCIGIPIAAGLLFIPFGITLSPIFAAFAMSLSSLFVVSNALRLLRK